MVFLLLFFFFFGLVLLLVVVSKSAHGQERNCQQNGRELFHGYLKLLGIGGLLSPLTSLIES
jgi:hypothetical protein